MDLLNTVHYIYIEIKLKMTIAARKQREKEDMRLLILDAAKSIFLEKGYEQTSLRTIAQKIQYSPGTIYLYFKDKDEIFHALHEEGFRRMMEKMQPLQFVSDPIERLKAMGRTYLDFAKNNKDLYELMFIMQAPIKHEQEQDKWEMGNRTLQFLKDVIRDCQGKGHFKGKDIEYMSFMIWSAVHGMSALYCNERCKAYEHMEASDLMDKGYQYFAEMVEKF